MATIRNAITMQDRMSPVFNKMLTAMQKTLTVMEAVDQASTGVMGDTTGIKQAQAAINAARNDVIKMQNELDTLNNKHVNVSVDVAKSNALNKSAMPTQSAVTSGVSTAQTAGTPPASMFIAPNTPQGIFAPLTKEAEEANAAAQKLERSINGIRAPNDLASSFMTAGSQGSYAGRAISAAMAQAKQNAAGVNVEGLKVTKTLAGVDYQALQLGSNNFGQQMKEQLDRANKEAEQLEKNLDNVGDTAQRAGNGMKLLNFTAGLSLARQAWSAVSGSAAYLDNLSQIQARLNNINDGSQTTAELQGKIMAAANRSRGSYQDLADTVAKLNLLAGDSFKSNDEAIAFAEQLNKMFVVSGTSAQEASAAMYQLNQALASGRLQGDEFRSIIENAPMLANAIAKSMGVSRAELKEMSSDGAITADVIKRAMVDCADEVNAQFAKMPMTFGQAMNLIQNEAAAKFQAVSNSFSEMINGEDIQIIADAIGGVITGAAYLAIGAIKLLSGTLGFLRNNLAWIAPIAIGLATAFGLYTAALIACKIATVASTIANGAHALSENIKMAAMWLASDATLAETAAQWGLNAALLACPITWIILAIIALIVLIYAVCGALNSFAGTSISATGVICGAFMWLASVAGNVVIGMVNGIIELFVGLWNFILSFADFFTHFLDNPVKAIVHLLGDMVNGAIDVLASLASVIDAIFGSDLSVTVEGWKQNVNDLADSLVGKQEGEVEKLNAEDYKLTRFDNTDAYNNGYNWGAGVESDIGDWFSGLGDLGIPDMSDLGDQLGALADSASNPTIAGGKIDKVKKIEDDVELSDEDIKMLKDIASTKYINKFTTLQPNMSVNFGDVHENADVNKIMEAIEEMAEQALAETILEE
ncbi:tape measure protein [[Clostridium] innocuum]|nr:tape measure protein [[Clostridium] innocuum]